MKHVGEPGAGEPHARFDGGRLVAVSAAPVAYPAAPTKIKGASLHGVQAGPQRSASDGRSVRGRAATHEHPIQEQQNECPDHRDEDRADIQAGHSATAE